MQKSLNREKMEVKLGKESENNFPKMIMKKTTLNGVESLQRNSKNQQNLGGLEKMYTFYKRNK